MELSSPHHRCSASPHSPPVRLVVPSSRRLVCGSPAWSPDGSSQLTLGGWPVYVNRNDDGQLKVAAPGLQAAGWFAMSPAGEKVTLPAG